MNFNPCFFSTFLLYCASIAFPCQKLSFGIQSYHPWIVVEIFFNSLIFFANLGFTPVKNHLIRERSSFNPLHNASILKSTINSSAVLDPCFLVMSWVKTSPGLSDWQRMLSIYSWTCSRFMEWQYCLTLWLSRSFVSKEQQSLSLCTREQR